MRNIRVASVQFEHAAGDKQANLARIEHFVRQAAAQSVEILVFPECCITGYLFLRRLAREQLQALAEPVRAKTGNPSAVSSGPNHGPSSQALMALATEYNMTIGAGLV
ncbi:MAG: nitrilase-related carbon-nitrogen hydrolase, partial [Planctomycetota bacterium]